MNDLIDRQAAIEAVYKCADIFAGDMPVMVVKADAYEALAQLPSAQPEQQWIPCNERLPESDDDVLVTVYFAGISQKHGWNAHLGPKYYVEVARYSEDDEEWYSDSDEYKVAKSRHKVIAWAPLPEPYKGEP